MVSWFVTDMAGGENLIGVLLCLGVGCGLHWGVSIGELREVHAVAELELGSCV